MSKPVPILFTIPNFITAGSGRALIDLIEQLDSRRFAPSICVSQKGGALDKEVERLGIPFLEAPFTVAPRPYASLLLRARRAARRFREGRYLLWHSFHYADDYTEPIIARMAGARAWIYWKKNMFWGSRAWLLRTLFATRVIALNSDMLRECFSFRHFAGKTRLIHLGVQTNLYHPEVPPRLNICSKLLISADTIVVGSIANLYPAKGQQTVLRAVSLIPEVHLLLAGRPLNAEYAKFLENLAQSLNIQDRVHFLGEVLDIPALLAELDIFVLTTTKAGEGCPAALVEAMSSGRACIATNIPGPRDLIQPGKNGLLVPPEEVGVLAAALNQLIASPEKRRQFGAAARESVINNFTIEREAALHVEVYEEILRDAGMRFC
jgi:glycosyltransferase involved in cell wall biosynthesis